MESLLRPFVDVSDVVKCEFIVYSESKILEVIDLFYCFAVDGGGDQARTGGV